MPALPFSRLQHPFKIAIASRFHYQIVKGAFLSAFRFILLSTATLIASPALAQDAPALESPAPEDDASDPANTILVTGRVQRLYRTTQTTVGKSVEDPMNIPQAIQVINSDLFADQGARDATDIYRNISGSASSAMPGLPSAGSGRTSPSTTDSAAIRSSAFPCRNSSTSSASKCSKAPQACSSAPVRPAASSTMFRKHHQRSAPCAWS
jgi:hypothetical protein